MSELKAKSSGEIRARNALLGYWWYEKSEADKVIRHQKYKRCKAMEEWCDALAMHLTNLYDTTKSNLCRESLYLKYEYFRKWQTRWLELAEKFKPNNSTAQ